MTRAAMRHADWTGHPWFVVSALWGLVEPGRVVEPYNVRVAELEARAQALLGERVARRVRSLVSVARVAEVHAGEAYLRVVRGPLQAQGFTVEEPLAGMEIGMRLRWYREAETGVAGGAASEGMNGLRQERSAGRNIPRKYSAMGSRCTQN